MVFQNFALFPHLRVLDNVAYALTIAGVDRDARHARARELLELVQMSELAGRRIGALSGGQRQRVAIARALAQSPDVFLLVEPLSALDAKLRAEMQVELRLLQQRLGITTIVVTHDQHEVMTMADRIVVMSRGRIEQIGTPQEIYDRPANAFVAAFIGQANFIAGVVGGGRLRCGNQVLTLTPPAAFVDGSEVTLAIRPERARLAGPDDIENRLTGTVRLVQYCGTTREVHLETGLGVLIVSHPVGSAVACPQLGVKTAICLPSGALTAYPTGERALAG